MKRLLILLTFSLLGYGVSAQQLAGNTGRQAPAGTPVKKDTAQTAGYKLPVMIKGQDTIPVYNVEDTYVAQQLSPEEIQKQKEWNRMVYNVMKVWPYAMAVANKMQQVDQQMASMDKNKDKKQFLKAEEDHLKNDYTDKLKDLSPQQGEILSKLIARQTGKTSYSLIKQYKNGFTAFFYQGLASVYGVDLKASYDPNDDPQLEAVLHYLGY
jgi:hypothetical protein